MSVLLVTFLCSLVLCRVYMGLAQRWQVLDQPNERSSHATATPHGGGTALLLAFFLGLALILPWDFDLLWISGVAMALMILGIVDDTRGLSISLRLFFYLLLGLASAAVLLRGEFEGPVAIVWVVYLGFAMVWALNLYNFMDGIDGIAATQCILSCSAAGVLASQLDGGYRYGMYCGLLAASHLGFLVWNWAPARLFMGDAGSIPTGFILAGLAGVGAARGLMPFATWMILLAVFICDASWTLAWRIYTKQPFTQAHRMHAYQRLSRHWNSHSRVVLLLIAINVLWLFPLAVAVVQWPANALYLVILAYIPLLVGMVKVGKLT